jgi:hypothetical protein
MLDGLANGQRAPDITPGDMAKAEALAGRLFALEPTLRQMSLELGADLRDNLNAYVQADPDGSELRLLVGYGHFSEVMPEVHRGYYEVGGDASSGFRLEHSTQDFAAFEARDILLGYLVQPTMPPRPSLHMLPFDTMAQHSPDLSPLGDLPLQVLRSLREYYVLALREPQLIPSDAYPQVFGVRRGEWMRFRAGLWALGDFAYGIATALYAQYHTRQIDEERLWEALEWLSLCWREPGIVDHVSSAADLEAATVAHLLEPFVLDLRDGQTSGVAGDGYFPPLVRLDTALVTSPEFLRFFSLERNVLYVLNKSNQKAFDETASDHLEPQLLSQAISLLYELGDLELVVGRNWAHGKHQGEVDLLLFSPSQNAVLHIQAKAALAPQGARMTRNVEDRAKEGIEQARRLSGLDPEARDAVLSQLLERGVAGVTIADALLVRSHLGTGRAWSDVHTGAVLNLGLLKLLTDEARSAGTLVLADVPRRARQLLDDLVAESAASWESQTLELGETSIELPMLQYDRQVVAAWHARANPRRLP